jgi:hypothetical protein
VIQVRVEKSVGARCGGIGWVGRLDWEVGEVGVTMVVLNEKDRGLEELLVSSSSSS